MKHWGILLSALIVVVLAVFSVRLTQRNRAQHRRETAYQLVLASYTDNLKLGTTRKDVEDYLNEKGVRFSHHCCDTHHGFYDLTKIGQEPAPWFCSSVSIYVEFDFTPDERVERPLIKSSDKLTEITISRRGEACL